MTQPGREKPPAPHVPSYCLIKIDERAFWSADVRSKTVANHGVYAFDRASRTHLCELTPSYCLVFIANDYDEVDGLSDDDREALYETVCSAFSEEPVTYMHVRTVESIIDRRPDLLRAVDIDFDFDERDTEGEEWNATFDQIAEAWSSGAIMY